MADERVESKQNLWVVIGASSAGTLIEWYDFYLFGSLAGIIGKTFFPATNEIASYLSALATFAAGFVVRPFGAIFFGRLGDIIGRKYTFLVTLLLMGGSTFAIGLIPGEKTIGIAAPAIVLILRLLQGLALGGEYGGAATYVAEHAPDGRRGFYTSWIQTTATLGLFVALGVILAVNKSMPAADFDAWGWRIPFLLSIILVILSYVLRMKLQESPLFQRVKASGKASKNPIAESFGNWYNLKYVLLALFGATAGQGVVWYTGQFYALSFLDKTLGVEFATARYIIAAALVLATPFFIVFGALSDRIGRKPIMMAGCLIALLTYIPIFQRMHAQTDLTQKTLVAGGESVEAKPAVVTGSSSAVATVTKRSYTDGTLATITNTVTTDTAKADAAPKTETKTVIIPGSGPAFMLGLLIFIQVIYVTMVYGPIAAFLVELFPTRIRYTSMSLPYHIGNGVFGGLVPFVGTWISSYYAGTDSALIRAVGGPMYIGLLYPITVAAITFIIGTLFVREGKHGNFDAEHAAHA